MSDERDETVTLELLGGRMLGLTAEMRDIQQRVSTLEARFGGFEARFDGLEGRFAALERRYSVQEERMSRLLSLVVRIAERQGVRE
jgi:hypothetical protein